MIKINIKLYYSDKCPDTKAVVDKLNEMKIEYTGVNITNSLAELKEFLQLRDQNELFNEVKKNNKIGIPTLSIDGKLVLAEDVSQVDLFK